MKDNKEYKEGIETAIELLQMVHDSLDTAGEPKGLCSYCGDAFESVSLVKAHVLVCKDNPFIAEIERLRGVIKLASAYYENDDYYNLGKALETE